MKTTKGLAKFISDNVTGHRSAFRVSPERWDGTVTVELRSSPADSVWELVRRFQNELTRRRLDFTQTSDREFSVKLSQFP